MTTPKLKQIIRDKMEARNMSVSDLSHEVKCHIQTLYGYFRGRTSINADLLEKILDVLDISVG